MKKMRTKRTAKKSSKPEAYHHGDLKLTLIDTAIKMLKTRAPAEISLRELAREAGVSQAAPYRHFKNKEELLAAIMTQGFELKTKYMKQSMEENKSDILKMYYGCGLSYFKMGKNHPQHFKLMFGSEIIPSQKYPALQVSACTTFALLKKMIVTCQEAGLVGHGDPYHKALNCWSMVHGFTMLYAEGRLEWLGVTETNAESAFMTLMSQYLLGNKKPLSESNFDFLPFQTDLSRINKENMDKIPV